MKNDGVPLTGTIQEYDNPLYVAFEGPIAAGKTTLANRFAEHTGFDSLLEIFEGNEFLADFYQEPERWSFQMQMWFLVHRTPALRSVTRDRTRGVVADYTSLKDSLFGTVLFKDREVRLFEKVAALATTDLQPPNTIVYLDASTGSGSV